MSCSEGVYKQAYAQLGEIAFEHTSYTLEAAPELRLLLFSPADAQSARYLTALLDREAPASQPALR
jgi:hypothetical protein